MLTPYPSWHKLIFGIKLNIADFTNRAGDTSEYQMCGAGLIYFSSRKKPVGL